jgi:hypothetical protein
VSTLLVLFMILPGQALFYGGLVRAKNVLSVLMQCTMITAAVIVVWVVWGYSFAFGGSESPYWGGLGKLFLAGVTPESESDTIPEFVFIAFQMTFACITAALIAGAVVALATERVEAPHHPCRAVDREGGAVKNSGGADGSVGPPRVGAARRTCSPISSRASRCST